MDYSVILTSTVIAAIVSSSVSGFLIILNNHIQRKHEEKKFILESAIKLVELYDNKTTKFIDIKSGKVFWRNQTNSFFKYFTYLSDIWNKRKSDLQDFDSPILG